MDVKKIQKLIKVGKQFQDEIKAAEDELAQELKEKKEFLKKIKEKLAEFVHKEEDGVQSMKLPDKSAMAYARYEDKYKMKNREEFLDDYILDGIPDKYAKILRPKLDIFGNTLKKDVCIDYRKETGAVEENDRLVGGDPIPGTGLYVHKEVRIIKGD